jgi:hypothetical protein
LQGAEPIFLYPSYNIINSAPIDFSFSHAKWVFMSTKEDKTKPEVVQLLNMTRACEIWGVTKWHVYDLIKAGRIKPITNAGKGFKFLATDYKLEFLERL